MPRQYHDYGQQWRDLNPDWVVLDWDEVSLRGVWPDAMPCNEIWEALATEALAPVPMRHEVAVATQRADILGYALLAEFGGVYLNCDLEPLRPLSDLPITDWDRYAWACYEDGQFLNNGAMGAPPGHPFFAYVLAKLPGYYAARRGQPMNWTTGPRLLTDCAASWSISPNFGTGPIEYLPRHLFHLASYTSVPVGGDASAFKNEARSKGAVALHHWGHKWQMGRL